MKKNTDISFNPTGSDIIIKIKYTGLIAGYTVYKFYEPSTIKPTFSKIVDIQDEQANVFNVPTQHLQDDSMAVFRVNFGGVDPENFNTFKIGVKIYQGDQLIGEADDENKKNSTSRFIKSIDIIICNRTNVTQFIIRFTSSAKRFL